MRPGFLWMRRFPRGPGELEVLDRVGDVGELAIDPGFLEGPVEQSTRRADEGLAAAVLLVTGLLTDEHDDGTGISGAEHRLFRILIEVTSLAFSCRRTQIWKAATVR